MLRLFFLRYLYVIVPVLMIAAFYLGQLSTGSRYKTDRIDEESHTPLYSSHADKLASKEYSDRNSLQAINSDLDRSTHTKVEHKKVKKKSLPTSSFIRITRDSDGKPLTLETAIIDFEPRKNRQWFGKNRQVSLVGAVHIGEKSFYNTLNKELSTYDKVLYELLGPKGAKPAKAPPGHVDLLSGFQYILTDYFSMSHQVDLIDYTPPNFVHADLAMPDLIKEGKKRGETPLTIGAGLLLDFARTYNEITSTTAPSSNSNPINNALNASPQELLVQLAESMAADNGKGIEIGETLSPYVLDIRNKEALRVLKQEYDKGHKKIAIFYGVAHLPELEKSLQENFDLMKVRQQWVVAWKLDRKSESSINGLKRILPRLKNILKGI
jgi:hypothetical protein